MSFELILPFLKPVEHLILDPNISEIMMNPGSRVFNEPFLPGNTLNSVKLSSSRDLGDYAYVIEKGEGEVLREKDDKQASRPWLAVIILEKWHYWQTKPQRNHSSSYGYGCASGIEN